MGALSVLGLLRRAASSRAFAGIRQWSSIPAREATSHEVDALLTDIHQDTPSVKHITLLVRPNQPTLTFKPGQWVDFFIPGIKAVGGFSICSTPSALQNSGIVELGVKLSQHPAAKWLHEQARPGDQVQIKVGGTFFLDPAHLQHSLLFVAGGVGITPLCSMLGSAVERLRSNHTRPAPRIMLLYSAKTWEELALLPRLLDLQRQSQGALKLQLHVTTHSHNPHTHGHGKGQHGKASGHQLHQDQQQQALPRGACHRTVSGVHYHRINEKTLAEAIQELGPSTHAYICGPSKMTDWVAGCLTGESIRLEEDQVHYEKWW